MNFLEICQEANTLSGMQGTVTSVTTTSGYQAILIKFVIDAYRDLQDYRDWPWMRTSVQFNTVQGTTEYSLQDIVGIGNDTFIKKWVKGMITYLNPDNSNKRVPLRRVDYDSYLRRNLEQESEGRPWVYAEDPLDRHLHLNPPDDAYTIEAYYYTHPVILAADADIPLLPVSYHLLIAYMGAQRMAGFMGNSNLYTELITNADTMLGNLLRGHNPGKRVYTPGIA
jgi:hypothetical protein